MTQAPTMAMRGSGRPAGVGPAAPKAKTPIGTVHQALRAATRNDHALIDRMLLPFDLSKAEDYRMFLNIHFAALITVQADWRLQDSEDFERMLRCVRADLKALGCKVPPTSRTRPSASPATGLGIAYVIRGSRLGAAVLRRGVVGELPTAYLDFVPALSWAQFLTELESLTDDPRGTHEAVCAARGIFNTFVAEFSGAKGAASDHDG
jgi:heme oxygenase